MPKPKTKTPPSANLRLVRLQLAPEDHKALRAMAANAELPMSLLARGIVLEALRGWAGKQGPGKIS